MAVGIWLLDIFCLGLAAKHDLNHVTLGIQMLVVESESDQKRKTICMILNSKYLSIKIYLYLYKISISSSHQNKVQTIVFYQQIAKPSHPLDSHRRKTSLEKRAASQSRNGGKKPPWVIKWWSTNDDDQLMMMIN